MNGLLPATRRARSREGHPAAPLSPEAGPDVADAPRRRDDGGMARGLHHATGHVAARAGDDVLGVETDPAQGRRGKGGLEGQPDEVEPGYRAAHPPALVRTAVGPQGAQGAQEAQVRAVAGGEEDGVYRLLAPVVPNHAAL